MSLHRLSDSVYGSIHMEPPPNSDSNKSYVVCEEFVVVVDTTYLLNSVRRDLKELREVTDLNVGYVINTHYHPDHTYGNHLFTCPIVAHGECPRLMKKVRKGQIAELIREETDPEVRRDLKKLRLRYPTTLFEQSYRLDSSPAIEVIHLGGHSPDLSVVHVPEENILLASDNLFGSRDPSTPSHPYMATSSDLNQWIMALKRMLRLEANVIVPGHFGPCNKEAVRGLIEYLELFMRSVRGLKERGFSKEEVRHRPELLSLPELKAEAWIQNNIETQYDRV